MSKTEKARMLLNRFTMNSQGLFTGPFYQHMSVIQATQNQHIKSLNLCFRASHEFRNSMNNLHGGAMASVLDLSALLAITTFQKGDKLPVATHLNIDYFKSGKLESDLGVEVNVMKTGKFLNFTRATLNDEGGAPIAQAVVVAKNIAHKNKVDYE